MLLQKVITTILFTLLSVALCYGQTTHEVEGKTITNELQVKTGAANGLILTSDAAGNATWQLPSIVLITDPLISDADGDTQIQVEESSDEDIIRFDLGGIESFIMSRTPGTEVIFEPQGNNENTFFGKNSGTNATSSASKNTFFGHGAGSANTNGTNNTYIGEASGKVATTGVFNTMIGSQAGENNTGIINTFVGTQAGENNTGSNSVFIGAAAGLDSGSSTNSIFIGTLAGKNETNNKRLYIDGSGIGTSTPLIYGEFDNNILRTNGQSQIISPGTVGNKTDVLTLASGTSRRPAILFSETFPAGSNSGTMGIEYDGSGTGNGNRLNFNNAVGTPLMSLYLDGNITVSGKISNVTDPVLSQDAATKAYVDSKLTIVDTDADTKVELQEGTKDVINMEVDGADALKIYYNAHGRLVFDSREFFSNLFFGPSSGINSSGSGNTGFGRNTLKEASGISNSAFGSFALAVNSSGANNSAFGDSALRSNTTGNKNTAFGRSALKNNTTGFQNSAFGAGALHFNIAGLNNTAMGLNAMYLNTNGKYNTAIGFESLYKNTEGDNNVAVGKLALKNNTTGNGNTAIGLEALYSNTTSDYNTAIGFSSLKANNTGTDNTAIGSFALLTNTTGSNNTAIGNNTLKLNLGGNDNTAVGKDALSANTSGNFNTATGKNALLSNTSGYRNTANGLDALRLNTEGYDNTAYGNDALRNNSLGNSNTASGSGALFSNSSGEGNIAYGLQALAENTTGSFNTALGTVALRGNSTGSNNIAIGHDAQVASSTGSNQIRLGNTSIVQADIAVAWTVTSDARAKEDIVESPLGLEFIQDIRPVLYHKKKNKNNDLEFGVIAQELEQILTLHGYSKDDLGMIHQSSDGTYAVRYNDLLAPMIKAIQELSQKNDKLESENQGLEQRMARLEALVETSLITKVTASMAK